MNYRNDERIVLTLDAGGTNFVFTAVQSNKPIGKPFRLPSKGHDLYASLNNIIDGFNALVSVLPEKPVAISFAFPGPADYPKGIIGDLVNLPGYRGGVALGPMLEKIFKIPVFINNDGNLFGLGEAISGFLPLVNQMLSEKGTHKQYHNLVGITLGTGFGGSIIINGQMLVGDNSSGGEIWPLRSRFNSETSAEESVSIRGLLSFFANYLNISIQECPEPKDIYELAKNDSAKEQQAAIQAFQDLGRATGDAVAQVVTMVDGLVVVGGGLAGAADLILPAMVDEMNAKLSTPGGQLVQRLEFQVYNFQDLKARKSFLSSSSTMVTVPFSKFAVEYDHNPRIAVGKTVLGTSEAISVGAYSYALSQLDAHLYD